MRSIAFLPAIMLILVLFSCTQERSVESDSALFRLLEADETNIDFDNSPEPTLALNVFNYMYFYNGGGIAAEDFNNDGFTDLYFTANAQPNKLFLNNGDLTFTDVTEAAGVAGLAGWTTGAVAVDINADGLMDLYVNQVGDYRELQAQNQLYICEGIDENGIPSFSEKSADYGLDLVGFGTQAAFFDFDLDGDLDMFQMNHSLHHNGTFGKRTTFEDKPHPLQETN